MRCYYVLLHGRLCWLGRSTELDLDMGRPAGLYCHKYVLAADLETATRKAINSVSNNLDRQTGWLRDGVARLELEAEEVVQSSFLKAFLPDKRGYTFYKCE